MESFDLARCLENKFGWASLMAVQKGVSFSVKDDSLATEFGPGSTVGVVAAGRNPARYTIFLFCFMFYPTVVYCIIRRREWIWGDGSGVAGTEGGMPSRRYDQVRSSHAKPHHKRRKSSS